MAVFFFGARRRRRTTLVVLLPALIAVATCDDGEGAPPGTGGAGAATTTTVAEDPGKAEPVSPDPAPVDPAATFAIEDVRAQAEIRPGLYMVLGTSPGSSDGAPVLTLGGAVREGEAWNVALDATFGPCRVAGDGDVASRADRLLPDSAALVVRCEEDEGRSTVYVFGAPPGTEPGVLLQLSCGTTGYELRGTRIAITSTDEQGNRRPDLEFSLDGPILETPGPLPSYCDRLDD